MGLTNWKNAHHNERGGGGPPCQATKSYSENRIKVKDNFMAMGIVSDDEFDVELGSIKKSIRAPVIEVMERPGRAEGDNNIPDSLRKIIGEESEINGRASALALAKSLGVSPSSVSAYSNGATSTATYDTPKGNILTHINKSKERVIAKAEGKLVRALNRITDEKLEATKARDLASIAKDMSQVMKNMEPDKVDDPGIKRPQFIIYAPQFKKEEHFETIMLQE